MKKSKENTTHQKELERDAALFTAADALEDIERHLKDIASVAKYIHFTMAVFMLAYSVRIVLT